MSKSRLSLQAKLEEIVGTRHVYFQPPASVKLEFPAIVYYRNRIRNRAADDGVYIQNDEYSITVIDKNPDSEIVRKLSMFPLCTHERQFKADNLNHDVFTLYY